MALRLFDGNVQKSANVDFWIKNALKYWPTCQALESAAITAKAELKRGKGNRSTVEAKLQAIQTLLKNEKTKNFKKTEKQN